MDLATLIAGLVALLILFVLFAAFAVGAVVGLIRWLSREKSGKRVNADLSRRIRGTPPPSRQDRTTDPTPARIMRRPSATAPPTLVPTLLNLDEEDDTEEGDGAATEVFRHEHYDEHVPRPRGDDDDD
jgi:hypothetical protein